MQLMRELTNCKMLTPKPYLSWTQLNMFEMSPEQYRRIYINGGHVPINRGMALGKEVATALENGESTGDFVTDYLLANLPKLEVAEMELEANIGITLSKLEKYVVPIKCVLDTASKDLSAFKEYKTGATAWDQKKVDKHGQITLYCLAIQTLTGKIPQDVELVWAPTEIDDFGRPQLTGEVKRFKTKRTTADMLKMKIRLKNSWDGIKAMVQEEII